MQSYTSAPGRARQGRCQKARRRAIDSAVASFLYVGLDVHKESIGIATADEGRDGGLRHIRCVGGDLAALDKAVAAVARTLTR